MDDLRPVSNGNTVNELGRDDAMAGRREGHGAGELETARTLEGGLGQALTLRAKGGCRQEMLSESDAEGRV